jgi:hypothetical protein
MQAQKQWETGLHKLSHRQSCTCITAPRPNTAFNGICLTLLFTFSKVSTVMNTSYTSPAHSLGTPPYQYEPLDLSRQQIRLVKIRRRENGPIRCEIRTFDTQTCPPYSALSYTWGAPAPLFSVSVNGGTLMIRENLYNFLMQYRQQQVTSGKKSPDLNQYIWIDQICI